MLTFKVHGRESAEVHHGCRAPTPQALAYALLFQGLVHYYRV